MQTLKERLATLVTGQTPRDRVRASASDFGGLVDSLHAEIDEKDAQIRALERDAENREKLIERLQGSVEAMADQIRIKDDQNRQLIADNAAAGVELEGFLHFAGGAYQRVMRSRQTAVQVAGQQAPAMQYRPQPQIAHQQPRARVAAQPQPPQQQGPHKAPQIARAAEDERAVA